MKQNIALVTGGYSSESIVSYKGAANVIEHIDFEKWNCHVIDINKNGWFYTNEKNEQVEVNKNNFSIILNNQIIKFDLAFICLHGTPGEDGKIQGYFDCLNIPYTSSSCVNSAMMLNKYYTTAIASHNGINVSKSIRLYRNNNNNNNNKDKILNKLALPVFVKANNGGSSIGMTKVMHADELSSALETAFKEDDEVLVEEFIEGREFTVGVIKIKTDIIILPITEIIIDNDNTFFDFKAKYEGKSQEITPANITKEMLDKLTYASKHIYETFNCKGVIRIDYIFSNILDVPVMLEINSIPGQTKNSIIPQQVCAMGWNLKDFYSMIIENELQYDQNQEEE